MRKCEIVWTNGNIRVVQDGKKFTPERMIGKDALGQESWQFTQWDGTWLVDLLYDLFEKSVAVEDWFHIVKATASEALSLSRADVELVDPIGDADSDD